MSKNLYDAAVLQLRGRALEALAALELLLKNPTAIPDHSNWVDEIIKHTRTLAENENTMVTLQQYFGKHFNPEPPAPAPPTTNKEPLTVTPEMSPTLKKELHRQKIIEAAKARRLAGPNKELYPVIDKESGLKEGEPKKKRSRKASKKVEDKSGDVE